MKRFISILVVAIVATTNIYSMSLSKIRNHARFLSDRMAYELDLTVMQYEYCYEINYDFIYDISSIMDDVVMGYVDAINRYYDYLDNRNEDLRYVLNSSQYVRLRESDYFYNPVYSTGMTWNFRIYTIYSNTTFFFFDSPSMFKTYKGEHDRKCYNSGYYVDRIEHGSIGISPRVELPNRSSSEFMQQRKRDFGVNIRERNKPIYNNYSNSNQRNRTQDQRYRDNSGNHNSPAINKPATTSRPTTTTSRRTSDTSNVNTNTSNETNSATTPVSSTPHRR